MIQVKNGTIKFRLEDGGSLDLRERLEAATGERIAALEAVAAGPEMRPYTGPEVGREKGGIDGLGVKEASMPVLDMAKEQEPPHLEL